MQMMQMAPNTAPNPNPFATAPNLAEIFAQSNPGGAASNPFISALKEASEQQLKTYQEGLEACYGIGYTHTASPRKILWQRGSAILYDYAPNLSHKPAVFIIPSLINQAYILDLLPDASFIAHLKQAGFRPLLLEWGTPEETELSFSTEDYLQAYAADALHHARQAHDGPVTLLGYCMGGIFALALAQIAPITVDGLVLMAAPWDFASNDTPVILLNPAAQETLRSWFLSHNPVHPALIQMIFYWMNPSNAFEKFLNFPSLSDEKKQRFAAIEHWVQNGVPLANKVAEECFITWPQENLLKNHRFKIGRKWLEPKAVQCETLIMAAKRDKIVPIGCATPLAKELKRATLITPDSGHVGMVAGLRASALCWQPVCDWLSHKFA